MKSLRLMIFRAMLLSCVGIFAVMPSALAQTTASEVIDPATGMVDRDKLKAFVISARDYVLGITDFSELIALASVFRDEQGDWKDGNIYLITLEANGVVRFHGANPRLDGKDLAIVEDDTGTLVFPKMLAAAQSMTDGGFVEYTWDDPSDPNDTNPKVCYVLQYTHPALATNTFILVGGYYQDFSDVEVDISDFPDPPEVTAPDVVDRETLKAFVQGAVTWSLDAFDEFGVDLLKVLEEFRREGGPWRQGSTYLYAFTEQGYVIFHGARPDVEGQTLLDSQTVNPFSVVRSLIEKAQAGGGYVEYFWDDPSVEGDEDTGSSKVGYAEILSLPDDFPIYAGQNIVIGSGFYTGNQVALDFAHFGNGSAITSDVVVLNVADQPVQPLIYFYDTMGELIAAESVVDVTGDLEVKDFGALTVQTKLEPLGELTISTNGQGATVSGSVKVVSEGVDSPIGGVLRFDIPGVGVAGVGASQPVSDAIFPARRVEGAINTGAALRNLSESELTLTCRLMQDGQELEAEEVTLHANGQDARYLHDLFEYDTSNFVGSVRCTAPPGIGRQEFTAVAVELDVGNRIFTTLPVIPVEREMTTPEAMTPPE